MNRTTRIWILLTLCAVAVGCADVSVSVDPSEGREFPSLKKNEKPEAINDNNKPENLGLPIDRCSVDHGPLRGSGDLA